MFDAGSEEDGRFSGSIYAHTTESSLSTDRCHIEHRGL